MAFPIVATTATSSRCSNDFGDVITMPASIAAGDLLIVVHASDTGGGTRTWSGDFLELSDASTTCNVGVAYKFAAGGDTLTVTKSASERFSAIALRITGMHATQAPEVAADATGTSANPDAGSLTASWGTEDNLWITWHGHDTTTTDTTISVWPYASNQIEGPYCASAGEPNLSTKEAAAATDDAGAWTISASLGWRASTIVVRPAAAATTAKASQCLVGSAAGWHP